jgi:hypothetical protein
VHIAHRSPGDRLHRTPRHALTVLTQLSHETITKWGLCACMLAGHGS